MKTARKLKEESHLIHIIGIKYNFTTESGLLVDIEKCPKNVYSVIYEYQTIENKIVNELASLFLCTENGTDGCDLLIFFFGFYTKSHSKQVYQKFTMSTLKT